jgi:hypothetical protein
VFDSPSLSRYQLAYLAHVFLLFSLFTLTEKNAENGEPKKWLHRNGGGFDQWQWPWIPAKDRKVEGQVRASPDGQRWAWSPEWWRTP